MIKTAMQRQVDSLHDYFYNNVQTSPLYVAVCMVDCGLPPLNLKVQPDQKRIDEWKS